MSRNLRLHGSLLVLLALLAACGDDDSSERGADSQAQTATMEVASPEATPTADATPTKAESTPIAAIEPATPTAAATATPSKDVNATPPSPDTDTGALEYAWLTAWDAKWEGLGTMVFGPDGRLYVDDYVRKQILVFDADGSSHETIDYPARIPEKALPRNDLAVGPDGRLYLLEMSGPDRVQVLEPDGTLVTEWGGTTGPDETTIFDARAIAVAPDGHVFVACEGIGNGPSSRLLKFTGDGEFVAAWARAGDYSFPSETHAMAIDGDTLYVAASSYPGSLSAVLRFDFDGNLRGAPIVLAEQETETGVLVPGALAVGPSGNLFAVDIVSREVVVVSPTGEVLTRWALEEGVETPLVYVEMTVDDDGHVYVADDFRKAILVYAPVADMAASAALSLVPAHAPCSTPVDAIGKGFEPGVEVTLIEALAEGGITILAETVADEDGVVTAEVIPQAGQDCFVITDLAGIPVSIDALVADEMVASADFTVYSMEHLAGLALSASEVTCDDVLTISGVNFSPGTDVIVTVGVQGGHQPVMRGQLASVDDDGSFDLPIDVSRFGPCLNDSFSFDEPQEYIIWAVTDRAKQGSAPTSYPSQRATIRLLPPVE